jgi:CrcB protein
VERGKEKAMSVFLVGLGGALGSVLRYWIGLAMNTPGFPWGTLGVNILGSGVIGVLAGLGISGNFRLFLVTGVLGGFTTFSSYSLEAVMMIERRDYALAAAYVVGSVVLTVVALFIGLMVARRAFGAAL